MSVFRVYETRYERKREWHRPPATEEAPLYPLALGHGRWLPGAVQVRRPCPAFGVELVLAGSLVHYRDGRRLRLGPGEALLKHVGDDFRLRPGPGAPCRKVHLALAGPVLPVLLDSWGLATVPAVRFADVATAKAAVRPLFAAVSAGADPAALGGACHFLLARLAAGRRRRRRPAALAAVETFVRRHLERPLRIADLARAAGVGTAHLHRLCREHLGTSPMDHVLGLRIDRARQLLDADPDLLVKQVARLCGFADQRYFARVFRSATGTTPCGWRARGAGQDPL